MARGRCNPKARKAHMARAKKRLADRGDSGSETMRRTPTPDMTPAELTAAREAANLRQVDLARLANIRREDLNHMEAGRRTIGPGMAARLLLAMAEHKTQQARERAEGERR